MKKIPTLFVRDPDDMRHVTRDIHPDCQWVLNGEGVATRKYDGTCVMFDGERWWARREVKPGKAASANFVAVETDETTGKTVGWEPIEQSAFAKYHAEALAGPYPPFETWRSMTYELCGPKINGNPEGFGVHVLVPHGLVPVDDAPRVVAGAILGRIDRVLEDAAAEVHELRFTVPTALVPQLELSAMGCGFPVVVAGQVQATDEYAAMPEWSFITFARTSVRGGP